MADDGWDRGWATPGGDGGRAPGGPPGSYPGAPPLEDEGGWAQPGQPGPADPTGQPGPGQAGWGPAGEPGWQGQPGQPGWPGPYQGYAMPPPGRRKGPSPVLLVLVAVVLFAAVGLVAAFVLSAGDDDDPETEPAQAAQTDAGLVPYDHPEGTYSLSLPEGWISSPLEGDLTGIGAEVFPDDPETAGTFQQMADTLPRSIVFVSLDRDDLLARRFVTNVNVTRVAGAPVTDLDQMAPQLRSSIEAFGAEVTGEGRFTTPAGEALRMEYELEGAPGVAGIQYHVPVGDTVWALAYTSDDLPADEAVADAVAATFEPGA